MKAFTRPAMEQSKPHNSAGGVAIGPTVLVVDDDPGVRGLLVRVLESEGITVVAVSTGEAALVHLRTEPPVQVVLLDVGLPGISGFEVCRQLKAEPSMRLIPVVMVTGRGAVQDRVAGIEAGADEFLAKPFERVELVARVRALLNLKAFTDELERVEEVLLLLARCVESRDPYTAGHCERLSQYAVAIGRHLGLEEPQLRALRTAGIVHDLGKIAMPDAILLKPGPLTPQERRIIAQHPVVGEELCRSIRSFALVRPIIRHHHERMDGSGYPDGLKGSEIPLTASIMSVVDVFDALTTDRPYRHAGSVAEALATLAEEVARGWRPAAVVSALGELISTGCLWSTESGEEGADCPASPPCREGSFSPECPAPVLSAILLQ